ncbi:uncharacterized protein LOC110940859 [Helianthus annuus]|uniref:uncharacterized protein LOC110940859 n=1 Tax=Helianthus annuus TaxID=4232 RepID=UPI0016532CC2|nr:uncharacterized protein LOC110940859 [Helianthus annuus]XP_035845989.1 uncharacterized protein LOC110940859 [Helianthus annuus]
MTDAKLYAERFADLAEKLGFDGWLLIQQRCCAKHDIFFQVVVLAVRGFNCKVSMDLSLFREFMILPTRASTFMEAMKIGVEVYHNFCLLLRRNMVRMQPTLAMKVVSSLIFRKTKRASSCSSQPLLKLVTQERSHVGNKLAMQEFMILPTILLVLRLLWKL